MSKTTTLHVHHAFLYISLLSLHNYDVKWPNFNFTWERERKAINSTISVWTRVRSLLFSSIPNSLLLSSWVHEDNREKRVKGCEVYFQQSFRGRRRCQMVYKVPIIKHKPHFSPPPKYLLANSPNWSPHISLKNKLNEFVKRSKHFPFGDYFINFRLD